MSTLQDVQKYYASLLILQYAGKPKFQQFIELVANQSLCDGLFFQIQSCFNLDTAVGAQLTIIGEIVGVPRNVKGFNPTAVYFSFTRATLPNPASVGFNRATTPVDSDFFLRAQEQQSYTLNDFQMLSLIQLKIIYNNTYSSFSALKNALFNTFQGGIDIVSPPVASNFFSFTRAGSEPPSLGFNRATTPSDPYHIMRASQWENQIMTLNYNVKQPFYVTMQVAQFLNIVPHSSGVNQIVNYI